MKIISGGQTGVDRGALDAALELAVPHGGWCPRGRLAEDGRIPNGTSFPRPSRPIILLGPNGTLSRAPPRWFCFAAGSPAERS